MSIASEITRLQGVKSDILTAIGNKGVTVPAGSALDDCPGLIASIPPNVDNNLHLLQGSSGGITASTWPFYRLDMSNRVCAIPVWVGSGKTIKISVDTNFEYGWSNGDGYGNGSDDPVWSVGETTITTSYDIIGVTIRKANDSDLSPSDVSFAKIYIL